jgi:chromatin structure-remodeling complex subunit RSC1/2
VYDFPLSLHSSQSARHFDRDPETNEVLWFAAPPLNIARKPAPRYSLQYLHWLATKRKAIEEDRDEDQGMEVDEGESEERVKRTRTATERVDRLLMEVGQD